MKRRRLTAAGWLSALLVSAAGCQCGPVAPLPDPDAGEPDAGEVLPIDGGPEGVDDGGTPCTAPVRTGSWLATQLEGPRQLAWDGEHLYFTEQGALSPGHGRVSRVDLEGNRQVVFASFNTPDAVAVDAQYVYVLDGRLDDPTSPVVPPTPGLWRINKLSGQPVQLALIASNANFAGATELALGNDAIFVATGLRWLMRVLKDTPGALTLYTAPEGAVVTSVAVEGADVYFLVHGTGTAAAQSGLYRVPASGTAAAVRVSEAPSAGDALLVTSDAFYWSENRPAPDGKVRAIARADGGVFDVATGLNQPASLARIDSDTLYFHQWTNPSPYVAASVDFLLWNAECALAGVAPVGPAGYGPGDLLVDGDRVFFSSAGSANLGAVGVLRR